MKYYQELVELLEDYKKTKFWKDITGDDIFQLKVGKKKVYVSVLGYHGQTLGFVVYQDMKDLKAQIDTSVGQYRNFPDIPYRASCFEVCVDDCGTLMTDDIKKRLKKEKIKTKHGAFRLDERKFPRLVTEEESIFLIDIVKQIIQLSTYYKEQKLGFPESFPSFYKMYSFERKGDTFTHQLISFPKMEEKEEKGEPLKKKELNKVLLVPKGNKMRLGFFISPIFDNETEEYPYLLLVEEEETHLILWGHFFFGKKTLPNEVLDFFVAKRMVPSKIDFISSDALELCSELLEEMRIEGEVTEDFGYLNFFYESIQQELIGK